ncbi:MAG TPA: diacylglycerol kinase family protein [Thermoleophilaceae bacterium]|nr:diacylglycerol kinase family protein [Thermoleophilaceae bacterium]
MTRRLALFLNPAAAGGRAARALPLLRDELDRMRASYRVADTRSLEHTREGALEAAAAGETVVAIGGDGLVGCLAGALMNTDAALGIVPGGRGNDFARVLGIPADPKAAARLVMEGDERRVDVAHVNGRPFVGIASVGFDSDANRLANEARVVKGQLVYLYAGLRTLVEWKPATFEVVVDGEHHTAIGYGVAVANSKAYGGGMYLVPHAELEDGRLDVLLTTQDSKLHHLALIPKLFKGRHVDDPYLRWLAGSEIEVSADRPFTVYADGDPIADLPVKIGVTKQALRVIAPR